MVSRLTDGWVDRCKHTHTQLCNHFNFNLPCSALFHQWDYRILSRASCHSARPCRRCVSHLFKCIRQEALSPSGLRCQDEVSPGGRRVSTPGLTDEPALCADHSSSPSVRHGSLSRIRLTVSPGVLTFIRCQETIALVSHKWVGGLPRDISRCAAG